MQMFFSTATNISGNPYGVIGFDLLIFISKNAWKAAVDYHVSKLYIYLPSYLGRLLPHCKNFWTPCMKIQAIMEFTFPRKRVFPVAVWWIDFYVRQRIANAHITCFQFFYRIIQYQTVHKRRINLLCFFCFVGLVIIQMSNRIKLSLYCSTWNQR